MKRKILSSDFYTCCKVNDITEIHINSIPTLYKYQQVSDYSLTHLDNSEIWGTLPKVFNDPYDCICCHTKSKIIKAINEQLSDERVNSYKVLFQTNKRSQIIEELVLSLLNNLNENVRSQYCVACFSIYNDSEIMWGHYADCAKGFVVAYDGDDLKNCALASNASTVEIIKSMNIFGLDFSKLPEDTHTTIMPVIYSDGKVNITENLIQNLPLLLECYDNWYNGLLFDKALNKYFNKLQEPFYTNLQSNNDMLYSILCNKNKCWNYEQEWRIWAYNSNIFTGNLSSPYVKIGYVPAKAIYLGEHISSYNKLVLIQIAKSQNIPIFQMKTKMYKNYCRLQPTPLDY